MASTEYHVLGRYNLDRHPKTLAAFRDWLKDAFAAVKDSLEHPIGIEESDLEFCTAVVRRASLTVARLGGGHLGEPVHTKHLHASALAVLGRMLAWVDQHAAETPNTDEVTIHEAASLLSVHPKTVRKYIAEGVLPARDAAPPSSKRPKYLLPLSAVLEFRGEYARLDQPQAPIRPSLGQVAKFKPRNFTLLD